MTDEPGYSGGGGSFSCALERETSAFKKRDCAGIAVGRGSGAELEDGTNGLLSSN